MSIALGMKLRIGRITSSLASVITTNLQAWHKFTATAWSGSNRLPDSSPVATNTAALYTGRGLDFDGVNDVVTVGATGVTVKTVIFYANPDTTTQSFMQLQSTGAVRIQIASGTLSATGFTSPTLYVNGAASSTVAASSWQMIAVTSATGVSASNVLFGQQNTTFYSGSLSNVKFFITELSSAQIAELYANPEQALPTGSVSADLVGFWPMADPAGSVAVNGVLGGKTGTIINGATPIAGITGNLPQWGISSANTPMRFDGTNDVVDFGDVLDIGTSDYTYAAWVIINDDSSDYYVMGKFSTTSGGGLALYAANGRFRAIFSDGTTILATSPLNYDHQKYVFASLTADRDGNLSCYVNGVLEGATSMASMSAANIQNSTTFKIGNTFAFTNRFFNGQISWAAAWNKVLTSAELLALYNSGAPISPTSDSGDYASASNLQGYWLNKGVTASDWQDLSGNGRHAVSVSGSPVAQVAPPSVNNKDVFGIALNSNEAVIKLPNSDSYASITDAATLDITTATTIEAWVKPFTVSTAQTIVGKNGSYALGITSAGKPVFTKWTSAASTATATTTTTLTLNTWAHLAATYDGTNVKLYINGVLNTTTAVSGAIDATSAAVLLGALTTSTQLFSGLIDSAKIYSSALTAGEVATNYAAEVSTHQ